MILLISSYSSWRHFTYHDLVGSIINTLIFYKGKLYIQKAPNLRDNSALSNVIGVTRVTAAHLCEAQNGLGFEEVHPCKPVKLFECTIEYWGVNWR